MKRRSAYSDWLALVSHEFFHAWNVRRLRPKVLMQYDYDGEQYFPELWVAEGLTSYYDDLFLPKSGLSTRDEYLGRLSKHIASIQTATGRQVQSLATLPSILGSSSIVPMRIRGILGLATMSKVRSSFLARL